MAVQAAVHPEKTAPAADPPPDGDGLGPSWHLWRRRRFVMACLAFVGLMSMYTTRINLSVAIVAMTSPAGGARVTANASITATTEWATTTRLPAHATFATTATTAAIRANASSLGGIKDADATSRPAGARGEPEFDWDSRAQGMLLSGFFYGYLASQMPAGWMVARTGGARLLGAGIAGSALLSLLTPLAARLGGAWLLLAVRVTQGLLQGVVFPSLNALYARWTPPQERSRMATTVASGCNVGTVVVLPASGLLAAHVGWPSIFYVFGAAGLLWWLLWAAFTADSPERDKRISEEERGYIAVALGAQTATARVSFHPWRRIFTSRPYLGKMVAHFCANWGLYTLITQMPMYLKDTLHFDIKGAGFVSALPYLVMALLLQISGHLADWLDSRQIIRTTNVRKLFLCGAFLLQACCLLLCTTLTDTTAVVACLTLGVALEAFAYATICVNSLDLAPLHASVLTGVSSTTANMSGVLSPQLTGFIVRNKSAAEWRIVFYITSGLYLLGGTVFALCGSAEKQPWAEDGLVLQSGGEAGGRRLATISGSGAAGSGSDKRPGLRGIDNPAADASV